MDDRRVKELTRTFKALANPNRLRLFLNLLEESRLDLAAGRVHDCFLSGLLDNLNIGSATVSHHVKQLEDAGLVDTRRDGKHLVCSIRPEAVEELQALFAARK